MFFLFKVYLKKVIPPSKISTKLKEMQISYDLFQAQHRQKIHTHYLVFHVGFPFILLRQWFPQVSSEIRSMVHGSLFCNSNLFSGNVALHSLKLVLFWFRTPKAETEPLGSSWHRDGLQLALLHQSSLSHRSNGSPLFFLGFYSKVIKFVGTCCLLLWQAALKCLNHSIAFILLPA